MKLRVIESGDRPQLEALFEKQGFEYILPDRDTLVAAIAVEDGGRIVQAVLARPTIELYFLMDAEWKSPALRMEALRAIHEAMRRELHGKGFEDAHVWIPPQKKNFVSRLIRSFGWTRSTWPTLWRSTAPRTNAA